MDNEQDRSQVGVEPEFAAGARPTAAEIEKHKPLDDAAVAALTEQGQEQTDAVDQDA